MGNKRNSKKILLTLIAVLVIFSVSAYICYFTTFFTDAFSKQNKNLLKVHFIDVGKADAIFIQQADNEILIDAGNVSINNEVNSYIKRLNVKDIDLLVATHPDNDHVGGMADIIDEFDIGKFLMPRLDGKESNSSSFDDMLGSLLEKNIPITYTNAPESFLLGNMNVNILAPLKQYEESNSNSVVLQLEFGEKKFLFTGDATMESEEDIVNSGANLRSDVLKVGHHGSKTSTSEVFLKAVSPQYAVISVGPDKNNLPKQEILDRLNLSKVEIYRTDLHGTVVMQSDGKDIKVKTGKQSKQR